MKVFDGKKAAQDYMSKHTLAFSTPELTLMRFAFWLGDTVPDPQNKDNTLPRMLTFMVEQDFAPILIDDDKYEPSGAVKSSNVYGNAFSEVSSGVENARVCFDMYSCAAFFPSKTFMEICNLCLCIIVSGKINGPGGN